MAITARGCAHVVRVASFDRLVPGGVGGDVTGWLDSPPTVNVGGSPAGSLYSAAMPAAWTLPGASTASTARTAVAVIAACGRIGLLAMADRTLRSGRPVYCRIGRSVRAR